MVTDLAAYVLRVAARSLTHYLALGTLISLIIALPFLRRRQIRHRRPARRQMIREALQSTLALTVFAAVAFGLVQGLNHLAPEWSAYRNDAPWVREPSLLVSLTTIALFLLAHDTYFYWTHRLMHTRWGFRWVHATHHRSHNPSVWSSYSFSAAEAVVQGFFPALFIYVVPMRAETAIGYAALALLINMVGHCGTEFWPRLLVTDFRLGWVNGSTHHDIHHATSRSNYGLYFRFWDRLMRTEEPNFTEIFERVSAPGYNGRAYEDLLYRESAASTDLAPDTAVPALPARHQ